MKRVQKFLQVDEVQTDIRVHKKLAKDALQIKGSYSWGFEEKKDAEDIKKDKEKKKQDKKDQKQGKVSEKVDEVEKPLKDFMPLKNIDIQIPKKEFVCVIGDVGSGKTSLLQAIIGDMIYLPQQEIDLYGGLDKLGTKEDF